MKTWLHLVVATLLSEWAPQTAGQVVECLEECIQYSSLSCQQWIDSMTDWEGDCCSFADVSDGSPNRCRLTVVGSCSWRDPASECSPDSTKLCVYSGHSLSTRRKDLQCPESDYSIILTMAEPTTSPILPFDILDADDYYGVPTPSSSGPPVNLSSWSYCMFVCLGIIMACLLL